ncbi:unnamed protein product [Orchesella dallaii]|uniref:Uncharacterized protein n=1 Tax=Orchesella dallaii TaxID=48710 RepID=A0ABP1PTI4_9HEXA
MRLFILVNLCALAYGCIESLTCRSCIDSPGCGFAVLDKSNLGKCVKLTQVKQLKAKMTAKTPVQCGFAEFIIKVAEDRRNPHSQPINATSVTKFYSGVPERHAFEVAQTNVTNSKPNTVAPSGSKNYQAVNSTTASAIIPPLPLHAKLWQTRNYTITSTTRGPIPQNATKPASTTWMPPVSPRLISASVNAIKNWTTDQNAERSLNSASQQQLRDGCQPTYHQAMRWVNPPNGPAAPDNQPNIPVEEFLAQPPPVDHARAHAAGLNSLLFDSSSVAGLEFINLDFPIPDTLQISTVNPFDEAFTPAPITSATPSSSQHQEIEMEQERNDDDNEYSSSEDDEPEVLPQAGIISKFGRITRRPNFFRYL